MKTSVRIGAFEIDDGELHGESPGDRTLTIPCKSDPDLCMQLDAWDAETSIPCPAKWRTLCPLPYPLRSTI